MILKHLFGQYKTGNEPTWGSRFMKRCGELVLGSLDSKGLGHLRNDLKRTYYYIKEDRLLPKEPDALKSWQIQSILLAQYRELEAPQISRATFIGLIPFIFFCVALAGVFNGAFKRAIDWTPPVAEIAEVSDRQMTRDECLAINDQVGAGRLAIADIPPAQLSQCRALLN